jgi:hypothetical protein
MSDVILLIGAGASLDAGLPLVGELTKELRNRLPDLHDVNGKPRTEFAALFDAIVQHDPEVVHKVPKWVPSIRNGASVHENYGHIPGVEAPDGKPDAYFLVQEGLERRRHLHRHRAQDDDDDKLIVVAPGVS